MISANIGASIASILFGLSAVAVRVAVQEMPPSSVAFYRYGQGALFLALALLIARRDSLRVKPKDLPCLALLGFLLFFLYPLAYNTGLRLTEVSRGSLMLATVPLWSALLARRGGERLTPRQLAGILLSVLGVGLVLGEGGLSWSLAMGSVVGCGLVLLAALCLALYGVVYAALARGALRRYHPLTVTTYTMGFGTLLLLPTALAEGFTETLGHLPGPAVVAVLYLGLFGGALALALWTFALKGLTPTRVAIYLNLDPIVATLLGTFFLAERPTGVFLFSFAAVLVGVLMVNWPVAARATFAGRAQDEQGQTPTVLGLETGASSAAP